ncbi:MAG: 16S rRNA processing protein RimM [Clostridia bacterium]|nr:16S rRNA processing protein RimM [Clostridia bacterium]
MMSELLEAGKICNIHGVKGYLKIFPWTDSPYIYDNFEFLIIDDTEFRIQDLKYHKNFVILKLEGIDNANEAEKFKEKIVYCRRDDIGALDEDTFFIADLISCSVIENGVELGKVIDIINTGASDIYEIQTAEKSIFYLPAVKENIVSIDIQNKIIQVKLPKGLLE